MRRSVSTCVRGAAGQVPGSLEKNKKVLAMTTQKSFGTPLAPNVPAAGYDTSVYGRSTVGGGS